MTQQIRTRFVQAVLVVCSVSVLVGWGCQPGTPPAGGGDADGDQDADAGNELLAEAASRAREFEEGAILIRASGLNGPANNGAGTQTVEWEFIAVNPDAPQNTYYLWYDRSEWSTEVVPSVLIGVTYFDLLEVQMTEGEARARLQDAGLSDGFHGWTLYKPVQFDIPSPLYAFHYGDSTATVDTATGAVESDQIEKLPTPDDGLPGPESVSLARVLEGADQIRRIEPDAVIVRASGRRAECEPMTMPEETDVWTLRAVCCVDDEDVRSWTLTFDGEWEVTEDEVPPCGVEYIDLTKLEMDVVAAWAVAVDAGHDPPFTGWSVFEPATCTVEDPRYVFPTESGFVLVNAVTGDLIDE